ncbi:MAG: alpha/beta hydrolase [Pseudomonadota bacterium]
MRLSYVRNALIIARRFVALLVLLVYPSTTVAGNVFADFPSHVDADASYVVYSHGLIVEGENPTPVHPRWGTYDFPAIKAALAEKGDFHLVAHHRSKGTDVSLYVERLSNWVRTLVEAGVAPERITLIGFSRGGEITARASNQLRPLPINTILLATCWERGVQDEPAITLTGRLLSIYETTDVALSCEKLAERSGKLIDFEEVVISTGKEHGAFFRPDPSWVDPLLSWLRTLPL